MQIDPALSAGYTALVQWSELIDRINVFPVADGDTGANLCASLAPVQHGGGEEVARELLLAATGNSGNISAAFFRSFILARRRDTLAEAAAAGSEQACRAVAEPQEGTMLTLFSALAEALRQQADMGMLEQQLRQAVLSGPELLPLLRQARVVDAGALAMYIFFTAFFQHLDGKKLPAADIEHLFAGKLVPRAGSPVAGEDLYCVDAILDTGQAPVPDMEELAGLGECLVAAADQGRLKIHLHTDEPAQLRSRLAALGKIITWSDEKITPRRQDGSVLLLLDAAGSLSPALAAENALSLVANSILVDGRAIPETDCNPADIYAMLAKGQRVGTGRAAPEKRHPYFTGPASSEAIYLCVGSAYTGNFAAATAWKKEHDPDNLFQVVDTGAASGRLGIIGLLTARYARNETRRKQIVKAARHLMQTCGELVFIDALKYLARSGRISRAGGFFGDLLQMKPVICPEADGVRKKGVVRNRAGQLAFLRQRVQRLTPENLVLLLEYSDNRTWLEDTVLPLVQRLQPSAEIHLVPLSLTSGVHMGPGTWAVAWGHVINQL